jgi:hypothetical protein
VIRVLAPPRLEGCVRDPVAPAQLTDLRPRVRLLQNADDLPFAESRAFPPCLPFRQLLTYRRDTCRGKDHLDQAWSKLSDLLALASAGRKVRHRQTVA